MSNELYPELMSIMGLQPLQAHIHSSRMAMFTGNTAQYLPVPGATPRRLQSGLERQMGKATFKIAFDVDAEIVRVIHRFPDTIGANRIKYNPLTIVVYENFETKEVGILEIPRYHSVHQYFGFEYAIKPILKELIPGKLVPKGTVVADSPLVDKAGNYCYGLEANVIFSSEPAGIEDGIKVSESFMAKIKPTRIEERSISFGVHDYPINLYGNLDHYRICPDIGEDVFTHGMLFSLREYDEINGVCNMHRNALCSPDYIFDKGTYIAHSEGKVIDITVECNNTAPVPPTPVGMEEQLTRYYEADNRFYVSILDTYYDLREKRDDALNITPQFQRLVVEAINRVGLSYVPKTSRFFKDKIDQVKVTNIYRKAPIPHWRVTVKYVTKSIGTEGFKLTDTTGGKGIVVNVVPDEDMPIDENGNRADIIMDHNSTVRRLNPARFYEQYFNAAARDTVNRLNIKLFGEKNPTRDTVTDFIYRPSNAQKVREAYDFILGFYDILVPLMAEKLRKLVSRNNDHLFTHVLEVCVDGMYLYFPPNNPISRVGAVRTLRDHPDYSAIITPVRFRNNAGEIKTSVKPTLIGSMYFMVLEKTAEDWAAVSSAKRNHFGSTARLTNFDKYNSPGRQQPTKTIGEAESRELVAVIGSEETADFIDAVNNPEAHKHIQRCILTADNPMDIDEVLDRSEVPVGGHRPLSFVHHVFQCSGKRFVRKND